VKTVQTSMLDFARDLIAIPTENPPGRDYAACVERIVAECDAHGLERRVVETGTADARRQVVLASAGDSGPLLYLHGHYDVVPAFDASQFSPRVEDGRLIGRGAADMKGGLAAILHAARPAAARGARIELVIVPDEETGGRYGSERLAELGSFRLDLVLVDQPELVQVCKRLEPGYLLRTRCLRRAAGCVGEPAEYDEEPDQVDPHVEVEDGGDDHGQEDQQQEDPDHGPEATPIAARRQ